MQHRHLQLIVIWAGLLNSFTRDIFTIFLKDWQKALVTGFEVNYVVWLALFLATRQLLHNSSRPANKYDYLFAITCLTLFIVPSALFCSLVVAGYTLIQTYQERNDKLALAGFSLLLLVCLKGPILVVIYKTMAYQLFAFDALMSGSLLNLFTAHTIEIVGNIIKASPTHNLIVILPCTSLSNIFLTIIAWTTVMRSTYPRWHKQDFIILSFLAIFVFLSNTLRIALMGLSPESYEFFHEGYGKDMYDVLLITITIGFIMLGRRWHARTYQLAPSH